MLEAAGGMKRARERLATSAAQVAAATAPSDSAQAPSGEGAGSVGEAPVALLAQEGSLESAAVNRVLATAAFEANAASFEAASEMAEAAIELGE